MEEKNRWFPTQEQKEKFIPVIKEFMKKAEENPDTTECIDFCDKGISPAQLKEILVKDMGFEEKDCDRNGWEMDFWITVSKNGIDYVIEGTGMTFELKFRVR